MIFSLSPRAVGPFIEPACRVTIQVGDDKARVHTIGASLDTGDNALDPAPAAGAVVELGVATLLVGIAGCGIAGRGALLECLDMAAQRGGRGHGEDKIEPLGVAEIEHLRRAIMAVGADQNLYPGPVAADLVYQPAQKGTGLGATRPAGRAQH